MKHTKLQLKRAYDTPESADGYRILIDRLWPRGLKKEDARLDAWMKEVSPSPDLRKWFDHDAQKWDAFREAYQKELEHSEHLDALLAGIEKHPTVTLVYAAKDPDHNHALVLKEFLETRNLKL